MSVEAAVQRAAVAWKVRVYLFDGINIRARGVPPCPCKGLGLVPRQISVRGKDRYTFDPCHNAECSASDRFKGNREVTR